MQVERRPSDAEPETLPYNPRKRISKPESVLIPLTQSEIEKYKNFRGQGAARLLAKRKRASGDESESEDTRPHKRHTGDVGVVVEHCESYLLLCALLTDPTNFQTIHGLMLALCSD